MKILVSNSTLNIFGGSEMWTYNVVEELLKRGYKVYVHTFEKGLLYRKILNLGAREYKKGTYDLGLLNHTDCIEFLRNDSNIKVAIQTCHGVYPHKEQPITGMDFYVSVSKEVQQHLKKKGFASEIIHNPCNLDRYKVKRTVHQIKSVLCLCQGIDAQKMVQQACKKLGIKCTVRSKFHKAVFEIEDEINKHDLIVGAGRGVIEALCCGRPAIVFDSRNYMGSKADGIVTSNNIETLLGYNFSGRAKSLKYSLSTLMHDIKSTKYDELLHAQSHILFDAVSVVDKYMNLCK